jgi:hypothetical protein
MTTHSDDQKGTERSQAAPASPFRAWVPSHDVQFYETDAFLSRSVAAYLVEGVRLGQPIVVIATESHLDSFAAEMRARGVNLEDLVAGRDIVWLDARDTLSAFMEGSRPSQELFDATVGNVFETLRQNRRYVMVRLYGEMVDLLWKDGKAEAALRLEEMWNDLANRYSFSLLCAYSKSTLQNVLHAEGFEKICGHHSSVLASEASFTQL